MFKKIKLFKFIFIFFIGVIFFLNSCSQKEANYSVEQEKPQTSIYEALAGDFAPGQLEAHFLKHKNEFGNITQEQYLNKARELLNSVPNKDILEKIRANGDILHYRVSTGEFAVMARDGRIRTYFKANYKYWLKQ